MPLTKGRLRAGPKTWISKADISATRDAISKISFRIRSSTDEFADRVCFRDRPVSRFPVFPALGKTDFGQPELIRFENFKNLVKADFLLSILLCLPSPHDLRIATNRVLKKMGRTFAKGLRVIVFHAMLVTLLNYVAVARKIRLERKNENVRSELF